MKMRFSTACDYNYHQRESATECEHVRVSACTWPTFLRVHWLQLPLRARLSATFRTLTRLLRACATCVRVRVES